MSSAPKPGQSKPVWDPPLYARYADHRSRPFFDLIDRINAIEPRLVYDLGCGSGELTATLAQRWPAARVVGVDNFPDMLAQAARYRSDRISFQAADLASFLPPVDADVIVSNAAYQWVDGNAEILAAIAQRLPAGGWLGIQVPGNFNAQSHVIIRDLAASPAWQTRLREVRLRTDPVLDAAGYGEIFADAGLIVDTWETTYNQVLPGEDPVLEWVRGTALRPILSVLDDKEQAEFLADLAPLLRAAYPPTAFGAVFPFRRIFAVGHR